MGIQLQERIEVKRKKGASDTPRVQLPDLDGELDRMLEIRRQLDDLKAEMLALEESVAVVAESELDAACARSGKVHGRITLNGKLHYERAGRCADITDPRVIERLKVRFGAKYPELFSKKRKLTVPMALVSGEKADEVLVRRLTELGVTATYTLQPTEAYFVALSLDPSFRGVAYQPEADGKGSPAPRRQTCFKVADKKEV